MLQLVYTHQATVTPAQMDMHIETMNFYEMMYRWEWGKLSHQVSWATSLNSTKQAEEKMIISSIVWSHSKDLLHLAALKDTPRGR